MIIVIDKFFKDLDLPYIYIKINNILCYSYCMSNQKLILPSNKNFGYFLSFCIFSISCYFFYNEIVILGLFSSIFFIIILLLSYFKPSSLYYLNWTWMMIGYILGSIFNPIILGIIFYTMITPLSLYFKIIRRDELKISLKNVKTFWKIREEEITRTSFKNQF